MFYIYCKPHQYDLSYKKHDPTNYTVESFGMKEIFDQNGLNRFKSGFVVDNFTGHSVGDVKNEDYRNSIDYEEGYRSPGWDRYKKNKMLKWKK